MPEVLDLRELGDDDEGDEGLAPASADAPTSTGPDAPAASSDPPPPSGRPRLAVAVVVVLGLVVAYMLTVGRPGSTPARPERLAPAGPEQAAKAALEAWARFASTGDVAVLRDSFDPTGPQFTRLRAEAPQVATRSTSGAPYTFSAATLGTSQGTDPDEQLVGADVVASRPGEADQRFAWELVLRRAGANRPWLLWTVRDRAPTASIARGGTP